MTNTTKQKPLNPTGQETLFKGLYGPYTITPEDETEVQRYRFSVLLCGISFCIGIGHWLVIGPIFAGLWMIPMAIGLGLALKWIHIYLRPLHKALQIFWVLGCIGLLVVLFSLGAKNMLSSIATNASWTIAIGPLFAALTGLGFKEFFCFRRPEAIGLTIFIPIALLGHLSGVLNPVMVMTLMVTSALMLLLLALRKFGMEAAADVGDKSVFEFLEAQSAARTL